MTDNYPLRLIDAPVFKYLEEIRQVLAPADAVRTTHEPILANSLLSTLSGHGVNENDFFKLANLQPSEIANLRVGKFSYGTLEKIFSAVGELAKGERRSDQGQWVSIQSQNAQKLVARVRKPLEQLAESLRRSNEAGDRESILTQAQRVQLVALLRSLLAELDGTNVDRGRVVAVNTWLTKIAGKALERVAGDAIAQGISGTLSALGELYSWLKSRPAGDLPDDPGDGSLEV